MAIRICNYAYYEAKLSKIFHDPFYVKLWFGNRDNRAALRLYIEENGENENDVVDTLYDCIDRDYEQDELYGELL